MRFTGIFLIALALGLPFIWFPSVGAGKDQIALFSQYMGITALIAMSIAQLIATRAFFVEWIFGGLDRSYIVHKWLGIGAMVALLIHNTIDAEMPRRGRQNVFEDLAEALGELSLYGLIILVVISVATFIPYRLWKWTHRLMGGFFLVGVLHYLIILKPFSNGDPLGLYTTTISAIGLLAFVWRLLPSRMRLSFSYKVASVETSGSATSVSFVPMGRKLRHQAGQFAFVSFAGQEPHAFTISSAPREDGRIRMSIAARGDYTRGLDRKITVGMKARFEGPYGHFTRYKPAKPQIWIAAGVGITPFLARAQALRADDAPVHLVYTVRNRADAVHLDELSALAKAKPNLKLHLHVSADRGRLHAAQIIDQTGADPKDVVISFCGPQVMRESLKRGFGKLGIRGRKFRYEEFEIRTGIGVRRLADYVLERGLPMLAGFAGRRPAN